MWVQIAIWVITTVIGMLLAPKPPKPSCDPPYTVDDKGHRHYKPECD